MSNTPVRDLGRTPSYRCADSGHLGHTVWYLYRLCSYLGLTAHNWHILDCTALSDMFHSTLQVLEPQSDHQDRLDNVEYNTLSSLSYSNTLYSHLPSNDLHLDEPGQQIHRTEG